MMTGSGTISKRNFPSKLFRLFISPLVVFLRITLKKDGHAYLFLKNYYHFLKDRRRMSLLKPSYELYDKIKIKSVSQNERILVIPSWYPTYENPLQGCFFAEQSLVMSESFDVKILYGEGDFYVKNKFKYTKNRIPGTPKSLSFVYKKRIIDNEKVSIERMIENYEKVLSDLVKQSWVPDVIHAHSTVYGGIIAAHLSKKFKIPFIVTEHQMFLLHNLSRTIQGMVKESLEAANVVAAVSSDKKRAILMHGIKCDPIVVGNLVDDRLFIIKNTATTKKATPFTILIVAGSSYIKDLPTFFSALKDLELLGHKDFRAVVVGGGLWGGEDLGEIAKKLGVLKYCQFIDSAPREEMVEYYNNCDVFVSTSIAEGFQVSILEAMACGKPVVSTMHGGVEDVMCADNGILVPIKDHRAVADAIIKIKTGKIKYDPKKIRKIVVTNYGRDAFRDRISGIYESLIKKGGA